MIICKEKVLELMNIYAEGNYHKFARILGIDVGYLHKTLNIEKRKGGRLLIGAIIKFCEKNNLDFKEYFF